MLQRRILSIAAAALLATAAGQAAAQAPAPIVYKIGFVSTEKIMRNSRAAQQMQKGWEAEFQKRNKEIAAGPAADIDRRRAALSEDINARREDALKQFIDKSNDIIRRIAEAEKFDAVFLEAAFASSRIDITDKVIKAIDGGR